MKIPGFLFSKIYIRNFHFVMNYKYVIGYKTSVLSGQ